MKRELPVILLLILIPMYLILNSNTHFFPHNFDFSEQEKDYFDHTTYGNNSGQWYEISRIRDEVQGLVDSKNFAQLEKMVEQARTQKLQFNTTTWVLLDLYNAIPYSMEDYSSIQKFVDEWRIHSPESNIPDVIEARAFYAKAWELRGEDYSHKVSEDGYLGFKKYLSKSSDSMALAVQKGPMDGEICKVQVEHAFIYLHDRKLAKKIFKECVQLEPGYIHLYEVVTNYMQDKWGGSDKKLLQFVEDASDATKPFYGDGLYALLVASLRDDYNKSLRIFKAYGGDFSWQRTQTGFEDIIDKFGSSTYILHIYAYCAMLAKDDKVLAEILKEIGTEWNETKEYYFIKRPWYDSHLSQAIKHM